MSLKQQVTDDMKTAMREKDTSRLSTIRLLLAAMKQKEVDERVELTDTDIVAIIDKMLKQRRDSIAQYEAANRTDLADQERLEMTILMGYMPAQLSEAEVAAAVDAVIAEHGKTPAAMGKIMAALKLQLAGKTDLAAVSAMVKAKMA